MLFVPPVIASAFLFDRGSGVVALILSIALSASLLDWDVNSDFHTWAVATFFIVGSIGLDRRRLAPCSGTSAAS